MAISVFTEKSTELLAEIKRQIEKNEIRTWTCDDEGDFTHTPASGQFSDKAWFRPETKDDRLLLRLITVNNKAVERGIYAVYHGRFIEMLIKHVPDLFTAARATPNPIKDEAPIEAER